MPSLETIYIAFIHQMLSLNKVGPWGGIQN